MGVRPILIALCGASLLFAGCKQQSVATPLDASRPFAESTTQPAGEDLHLQGFVNDAAGVLSREEEKRLSSILRQLEMQTGHQLVVVTTPSLGEETISDYALTLGRRWGIGRKDINDGVVILLAPKERKARIEVGYGLERALPDLLCKSVIEHEMIPDFRKGAFGVGLEKGVTALSRHLH